MKFLYKRAAHEHAAQDFGISRMEGGDGYRGSSEYENEDEERIAAIIAQRQHQKSEDGLPSGAFADARTVIGLLLATVALASIAVFIADPGIIGPSRLSFG